MSKAGRFLRGVAGVALGLFASFWILLGGRALAFGDGFAPSPENPSGAAQVMVVLVWAAAGAMASWVAAAVSRGRLPSLIASAWLFQMAWLSPGVRPAEIGGRFLCSFAAGLGGFAALVLYQYRRQLRHPVAADAVR